MPDVSRPRFLTTTANALDGYRVLEIYGVVRGITVRSRSVFGTVGVQISWLWLCSREAPAAVPTFLKTSP